MIENKKSTQKKVLPAPRKSSARGAWLAWCLLIAGLILTGLSAYYTKNKNDEEKKREFDFVCNDLKTNISARLYAHAQILRGGSAFFAASDTVTRKEWKSYIEHEKIDRNLPGIQGIGFSLIIPKNRLDSHIQYIRKEGFPDYKIKPEISSAGEREIYTSIVYLEPFSGRNLRAFGYDMYSEPVRRTAMIQARDSNIAMLTGKVILVQETEKDVQAGTLMYVPVYKNGMPVNTVVERRAAIKGWVYSPYRMNDLMQGILGRWDLHEDKRIHLQIYDGDSLSKETLLFDSQIGDTLNTKETQNLILPVDFNGKRWSLSFAQLDVQSSVFGTALFVLTGGIVISLLIFVLTKSLLNTRFRAGEIAEQLTIDLRKSEENFRAFFSSIADLLFVLDEQGNITDVNDTVIKRLEYSRKELIGQPVLMIHPSARRKEAGNIISDMLAGKADFCPVPVISKNGVEILVETRVYHGVWDGKPALFGVTKDVTKIKQSEIALIQQSKMQKILMDMASSYINVPINQVSGMINKSLKEMGEFVSADRCYIFNYDFNKQTTSNEFEWCDTGVEPQIEALQDLPMEMFPDWVNAHRGGDIMYIEDVLALPDGTLKEILEPQGILSLLTIPMMSGGECIGFVGFDSVKNYHKYSEKEITLLQLFSHVLVNVKNRAKAETELLETNVYLESATAKANEMAAEAERANKSKSVFLANISHEIRTPLNAIIGFSQLMNRDKHFTDSQKEYNISIIRAGEHLLALINDILELSKVEAGRVVLNPANVDLYSLFEDIKLIFKDRAKSKHLQFIFETADDLPRYVTVDENKLRQIFVNLIGNAIKFTEKGGVAVRTRIEKIIKDKGTQNFLLIAEIQDSGPGIPENELGKLFRHFEQTSSGIQKGSGTGLGLALSRELALLLGGNITVSSEVGKGSVFSFFVKIGEGKIETSKDIITRRVISLEKDQVNYRVLVVDDREENLRVAVNLLKLVGFETNEAVNGQDAIEKFEEWNPDLILMDMRMPVMDGYEAIRRIKSTEKGKLIPVIALTASTFEEEHKKIELLGLHGYIRKPFRENELFNTVGKVLGVKYIYEEEKILSSETRYFKDDGAIGEDISKLPDSVITQMQYAVSTADIDLLSELINSVEPENSELAQELRTHADNYDYDYLNQILNIKEKK